MSIYGGHPCTCRGLNENCARCGCLGYLDVGKQEERVDGKDVVCPACGLLVPSVHMDQHRRMHLNVTTSATARPLSDHPVRVDGIAKQVIPLKNVKLLAEAAEKRKKTVRSAPPMPSARAIQPASAPVMRATRRRRVPSFWSCPYCERLIGGPTEEDAQRNYLVHIRRSHPTINFTRPKPLVEGGRF